MQKHNTGFTLIELLVVVLIIGILSAVALPQYTKAVEKSRAAQALSILKSLGQAQEAFFLANNTYAETFDQLDLGIDWTGTDKWLASAPAGSHLSNADWSLQLWGKDSILQGVGIGRLKGEYAGAGFAYFLNANTNNIGLNTIVCIERVENGVVFQKERGAYCEKLWGGQFKTLSGGINLFSLP